MSTLFVGRLRNKGDKLIAAAPQIAAGFQQAGDALRQYEADRNAQQKERLLNAKVAADIAGGWAYLSPEAKNELPDILGIDFNKDPITGDVQIDKTFDNLVEEAARKRVMADPETAVEYGLIKERVMSKAPHPAELELAGMKIQGDLAGKKYSADLRAESEALRHDRAIARMGIKHSYDLDSIYARNALKGTQDNEFSEIYLDPSGKPVPSNVKHQLESQGVDTSEYKPLTMKQAKTHISLYSANTSRANQESTAKKRDFDIRASTDKLAQMAGERPEIMGVLKRLEAAMKVGDKPTIQQAQQELAGFASFAAQEAGVDPENYNDSILNLSRFFRDESSINSLMAEATRRRVESASGQTPVDPTVRTGTVGNVSFSYKKKGETVPTSQTGE